LPMNSQWGLVLRDLFVKFHHTPFVCCYSSVVVTNPTLNVREGLLCRTYCILCAWYITLSRSDPAFGLVHSPLNLIDQCSNACPNTCTCNNTPNPKINVNSPTTRPWLQLLWSLWEPPFLACAMNTRERLTETKGTPCLHHRESNQGRMQS
jgi:hypothetical protein